MNSKGNEGRRLGTRIEVDFDFHLPSLRTWLVDSRREKGFGKKKRARKREEGGGEQEEKQKEGGREDERQEESETEIEKEDDAPSPRFEVENFLIENYESYLLCRGFRRRVV